MNTNKNDLKEVGKLDGGEKQLIKEK